MSAPAPGARTIGAFALVLVAALFALVAAVPVAWALSSGLSARQAGDLLVWMGGGLVLAVVAFVAGFHALARRWAGVAPPWWASLLLGVLLFAAAAVLFVLAMIGMNR